MTLPEPPRRDWLKRCGALGLATLGGCACPCTSLPIGAIPELLPGAMPSPPPQAGSLALPIVIDAHCHIFNVHDVPGSPFLKGPVANEQKSMASLIRALADLIATIAYLLTPSAREEMRMLETLSEKRRSPFLMQSPETPETIIDEQLKAQRQRFSRVFSIVAPYSSFGVQYRDQLKRHLAERRISGDSREPRDPLSEDAIYDVLTRPEDLRANAMTLDPRQLLRFGFTLTSPRYLNLAAMQRVYSGGTDVPAVDVFCPSMLDLDYWLGCNDTATSQQDQMLLLEQIAIVSGGAILPLIAYNPRSDLEQNGTPFERVVDAISNRGFIGVKLYPPMGYRAYGNGSKTRSDECPLPDNGNAIDDRLGNLYQWCIDHNVPIMAHSSHSFGESDAKDECASPRGWQQALEKFGGLHVQAGHFGGESDYSLDTGHWAEAYVGMMGLPNDTNLYADLSNLDQLFVSGSKVRNVMDRLFSTKLSAKSTEVAANRMVYGSDWFLTLLSNASDAYVARMNTYLAEIETQYLLPDLRKWVFGLNAAKLYGLFPGPDGGKPTNWDRLTKFYADKRMPTPAWMCKLGRQYGIACAAGRVGSTEIIATRAFDENSGAEAPASNPSRAELTRRGRGETPRPDRENP